MDLSYPINNVIGAPGSEVEPAAVASGAAGQIEALAGEAGAERFGDTRCGPGVRGLLNRIALGMAGALNRVRQTAGSSGANSNLPLRRV